MTQREPLEILHTDHWPEARKVLEGVVRTTRCTYKVNPSEAFSVVAMTDQGADLQKPDEVVVETAHISDKSLNEALAQLIMVAVGNSQAVPVLSDRLREYMTERKYVYLLCHPSVELPEGHSGIRHTAFPPSDPEDPEVSTVFLCEDKAGILVQTHDGLRGAFIRPSKFVKLRLEAPIPTALERLLEQDLFEE